MADDLFGADIAGKIDRAMSRRLPRATLVVITPGTRTAGSLSGGTQPTKSNHRCRAVRVGVSALRPDTIRPETKDAVLIIAQSIKPTAVPKENDQIIIKNVTALIVSVTTDPADASHLCQVK